MSKHRKKVLLDPQHRFQDLDRVLKNLGVVSQVLIAYITQLQKYQLQAKVNKPIHFCEETLYSNSRKTEIGTTSKKTLHFFKTKV